MGVIADSIVAFAQPLLDETDGSFEQMDRALAISQFCWNHSLLSKEEREADLSTLRNTLHLDDD